MIKIDRKEHNELIEQLTKLTINKKIIQRKMFTNYDKNIRKKLSDEVELIDKEIKKVKIKIGVEREMMKCK